MRNLYIHREDNIWLFQYPRCILAVNEFGFWVYSLQGRAVTVPQVPNIQSVNLTENVIHLAPDHLAIRDATEQRGKTKIQS
jgi:hypothetical protein